MDERYAKVATPPASALKAIEAGRLRGKTDINPQWKIEAMTEVYGLCGIGWVYKIEDTTVVDVPTGEKMVFMMISLQVKDKGGWSQPIYGFGGDFIIAKERNGLHANDEAYKMCLTDALGNAMKCLGVASDIFRGLYETKYEQGCPAPGVDFASKRKSTALITELRQRGVDPSRFASLLFHKPLEQLSPAQIKVTMERLDQAIARFQELDAKATQAGMQHD